MQAIKSCATHFMAQVGCLHKAERLEASEMAALLWSRAHVCDQSTQGAWPLVCLLAVALPPMHPHRGFHAITPTQSFTAMHRFMPILRSTPAFSCRLWAPTSPPQTAPPTSTPAWSSWMPWQRCSTA